MSKALAAVEFFKSGFNCSQAVLHAFSQELGLDQEKALKIACGFGAGMAKTCQTCGAVTGAYMVIGLKHGRARLEDTALRDKTYALIQEFDRQFTQRFTSVNCRDLIGYDLGKPDEYQQATAKNLFHTVCADYVKAAVELLEKII